MIKAWHILITQCRANSFSYNEKDPADTSAIRKYNSALLELKETENDQNDPHFLGLNKVWT